MPKSMNRTDHGGLLSGSTLKWLAILLMLIDHVGASLLEVFVLNGYSNSPLAGLTGNVDFWWKVDRVLRYIGRSAFPIFCFLLVEGAVHTRDIRRYAGRMIAFAFVSELPFDLALRNHFPWWAHQNVFFTLALGLSAILVFQRSAGSCLLYTSSQFWYRIRYQLFRPVPGFKYLPERGPGVYSEIF